MVEFVETLFTSEITIALIHPLIHPLLFFFHFSSWNAQLGHGPKISIFHNLVSEKASSNRAHGWKLSRHLLLETSTVLGSRRRYLSFTAKDRRLSSASRSSKTLGYASSRSHRPPRPHFLGWITAKLGRIAITLVYVISEEEIARNREDDVISWVRNDTLKPFLNRGKFGLRRIASEMRLRRIEKRMVLELETTYKNMVHDLKWHVEMWNVNHR